MLGVSEEPQRAGGAGEENRGNEVREVGPGPAASVATCRTFHFILRQKGFGGLQEAVAGQMYVSQASLWLQGRE